MATLRAGRSTEERTLQLTLQNTGGRNTARARRPMLRGVLVVITDPRLNVPFLLLAADGPTDRVDSG
jgi:hypothetical protein